MMGCCEPSKKGGSIEGDTSAFGDILAALLGGDGPSRELIDEEDVCDRHSVHGDELGKVHGDARIDNGLRAKLEGNVKKLACQQGPLPARTPIFGQEIATGPKRAPGTVLGNFTLENPR